MGRKTKGEESLTATSLSNWEGAVLTPWRETSIYKSAESWEIIGKVQTDQTVEAIGAPTMAEGYEMVPIKPTGSVHLRSFSLEQANDERFKPHMTVAKSSTTNLAG